MLWVPYPKEATTKAGFWAQKKKKKNQITALKFISVEKANSRLVDRLYMLYIKARM